MSKSNALAKATVLDTLRDPAIKKIDFVVSFYSINGEIYSSVLKAILGGFITVEHDSKLGSDIAYYYYKRNAVSVGFTNAKNNLARQGGIIHECTHAVFDANMTKYKLMSNLASEAAAYIAQCMFIIAKIPKSMIDTHRLRGPDTISDGILRAAWHIAADQFLGRKMASADFQSLEKFLSMHPLYKGNISDLVGWDGIHLPPVPSRRVPMSIR